MSRIMNDFKLKDYSAVKKNSFESDGQNWSPLYRVK